MARVAVTGAAGRLGSRIVPGLEGHSVTAIDLDPVPDPGLEKFESVALDMTEDESELRSALDGNEVLVHLAAEPGRSEPWESVLGPNIDGTYRVFEAAEEVGVNRVIFASSNHVTQMHNVADVTEPNSLKAQARAVTPRDPIAPTGPYGISKVAGEAVGSYYANRFGMEVINVRIGWFLTPDQLIEVQEESESVARYARAMFLSPRDGRDAFRKAITAPLPENPLTVNLTSRNQERYLSITHTMRALEYEPQDDSAAILDGRSN